MSVQTTPGLALRTREVEKTPPRVPFGETLKQKEGAQREEDQESTEEPRDASKLDSPMDVQADIISPPKPPSLMIPTPPEGKETPMRSPRSPVTRSMTKSSPRTKAKQEHKKEEPTTPAQPSFIFSPPLTRSRGRRSAVRIITKETAPPVPPSFSQMASETVLTVPSPSPLPGESLMGGRGIRSGRKGRGGNASMTQVKEKPAVTPSRNTRRSLAVSHLPSPSEADSVVLLSPAPTEPEGDALLDTSLRRNPRRAVRVAPHSMTLRTPQEKKKVRKLKAW